MVIVNIKFKTSVLILLYRMLVIQSQSSSPSRLCRKDCPTIGNPSMAGCSCSHHRRLKLKVDRSAQSRSVAAVFGYFCCWALKNHSRGVFVLLKITLFRMFEMLKHNYQIYIQFQMYNFLDFSMLFSHNNRILWLSSVKLS